MEDVQCFFLGFSDCFLCFFWTFSCGCTSRPVAASLTPKKHPKPSPRTVQTAVTQSERILHHTFKMTTSTSAITRELFQLKEQIDQLTFKQRKATSPVQKDQLKMRLEGLRRTQRGLKHIRMLMLTPTATGPSRQEEKPPMTVVPQLSERLQKASTPRFQASQGKIEETGQVWSTMQNLHVLGKAAGLVNQLLRLRLLVFCQLQRCKPLQILKAAVALWFLSSFILIQS